MLQCIRPKKQTKEDVAPGSSNFNDGYHDGGPVFTMNELNRITKNFNPSLLIGGGGFGEVYKGQLADGTFVAVKRAKKNNLESRVSDEFKSEIKILANIEHLNLVKLLGYFEAERERIIVVEYVPNGNLRQHLDGKHGIILSLGRRLDIAVDVAHALAYLHQYADRPIIHRDIKSTNILLTETLRAKVADFGFSRVGPADYDATHVSTQVKGTAGYVDPEYLRTFQLTDKSDVYSFGILLIELLTGRRPIELMKKGDERVTVRWAYKRFQEGKIVYSVDPKISVNPDNNKIVERVAELAFQCVAPTRHERPGMEEVARTLWSIRKDYRHSSPEQSFHMLPSNSVGDGRHDTDAESSDSSSSSGKHRRFSWGTLLNSRRSRDGIPNSF